MRTSRRSISLSDTRSVLATTGDLAVGAFARRARRKRIGIALLGVLLIGAAGVSYWALREPPEHVGSFRAVVRCSKCGVEAPVTVAAGQVFPLTCDACHERTLRQVWQCQKCGHRFVPDGRGVPTNCPRSGCRSAAVGAAAPAE